LLLLLAKKTPANHQVMAQPGVLPRRLPSKASRTGMQAAGLSLGMDDPGSAGRG
jgi:hypothetical protein